VYVFVTTFTPGPNNILSMSHAVQSGYKKTLPFLGGIFTGFVVVMLLCGLLNFALINLLPQVRPWLNLLGAAYMVYLAIYIAFSKPAAADAAPHGLNSFLGDEVLRGFLKIYQRGFNLAMAALLVYTAIASLIH
jgi:threonine/homoserine/homoserine lactone efflux protein